VRRWSPARRSGRARQQGLSRQERRLRQAQPPRPNSARAPHPSGPGRARAFGGAAADAEPVPDDIPPRSAWRASTVPRSNPLLRPDPSSGGLPHPRSRCRAPSLRRQTRPGLKRRQGGPDPRRTSVRLPHDRHSPRLGATTMAAGTQARRPRGRAGEAPASRARAGTEGGKTGGAVARPRASAVRGGAFVRCGASMRLLPFARIRGSAPGERPRPVGPLRRAARPGAPRRSGGPARWPPA